MKKIFTLAFLVCLTAQAGDGPCESQHTQDLAEAKSTVHECNIGCKEFMEKKARSACFRDCTKPITEATTRYMTCKEKELDAIKKGKGSDETEAN